jgi:hypothetical protein
MKRPYAGYIRFVGGSVLGILGLGEMGQGAATGRWAAVAFGLVALLAGLALAVGTVARRREQR